MMGKHDELAVDPTVGVVWRRPDDHFVPVRACELVAALAADAPRLGFDGGGVLRVASALQDVITQEAVAFQQELSDAYAVFNPDRDTLPLQPLAEVRTPEAYADFETKLAYLLQKANFVRLTDVQVEAAIQTARAHGLRVRLHPERVAELFLWVRGYGTTHRVRRPWRHWHRWRRWRTIVRGERREVPVFRRLVVAARLKDDPHIIIKLFKDIPEEDVEALLPHAEVEMNLLDRLLVFGGGAGALGSTASKVVGAFTGVAVLSKLLWVIVVGLLTMTFRTVMGYKRARSNRDSQRTRHLYFRNLGNNSSALQTLVAIVTQEEVKEALLAYAFCQMPKDPITTAAELAAQVEVYLQERFGVQVNFDVDDAVETLTRLELWQARQPLCVICADETVQRLRAHWTARQSERYHHDMAACVASGSKPATGPSTTSPAGGPRAS